MWDFPLIPEQASTYASKVDPLFYVLTIFVGLFAIAVTAVMIYLGMKYRKRPGVVRKSIHTENMWFEIIGAGITLVISLAIFWWGAVLFFDFSRPPENTLDINVIGKRWMWKLQHSNGKREVNELHIPLGQPIKLTMTSQDVIHSFYVPAFRVKQDVLPARYTSLWFEATKTGEFPLFCAEYCGTQHSTMGGKIIVLNPADFEEWLGGGPPVTPALAGETLFDRMGCATCHAAGDVSRGPSLLGVYGSEVSLRGGESVIADEDYLRASIMEPSSQVTDGYAALMPSFKALLSEEDILNLIAYIKTLSNIEI